MPISRRLLMLFRNIYLLCGLFPACHIYFPLAQTYNTLLCFEYRVQKANTKRRGIKFLVNLIFHFISARNAAGFSCESSIKLGVCQRGRGVCVCVCVWVVQVCVRGYVDTRCQHLLPWPRPLSRTCPCQ